MNSQADGQAGHTGVPRVPKQIGWAPLSGTVENALGLAVRGEQLPIAEMPLANIPDQSGRAAWSGCIRVSQGVGRRD